MKPVLLDIPLDRRGCLHRQVFTTLRDAIRRRDLPAGAKLPSTRALARHLDVSRNTVLLAYEQLAAEGLITGRIGSGTRVSGRAPVLRLPSPRKILAASHYPSRRAAFVDPEGNSIYVHTS